MQKPGSATTTRTNFDLNVRASARKEVQMNKTKISNHVRLIAFFLTAVILVCTFGFTVDGWQNKDGQNSPPNEDNKESSENDDPTDAPADTNPPPDEGEIPDIYIPKYTNRLTGLECSEEIVNNVPLAFIMNSEDKYYGISSSDILIEIPIEEDKTRLISFITNTDDLWKIGSICPTRGYLNNISKYFGALGVFYGQDDRVSYESCDVTFSSIDLSKSSGCYYTEFSDKAYTNKDLIEASLVSSGIKDTSQSEAALPFNFVDFTKDNITYDTIANKAEISTSKEQKEFIYNSENGTYTYKNNGVILTDALNGKPLNFTNCFILFADSITYDYFDCNQTVIDTIGSGKGYYFTNGSVTEIRWTATSTGILNFYSPTGEKLTINRGNSYIGYVKSSRYDHVIFS